MNSIKPNGEETSTFKGYLSDVGIYSVVQLILLPLSGLVTLALITKGLGVSDYGIYALLMATAGMLVWFVRLQLPSGIIRFLSGEKDKRVVATHFVSVLVVIWLAGIVTVLITLALSDLLATQIFHDANAKIYLILIAFRVVFEASNATLYSHFRILEKVRRYAKYEVLFSLTGIGLLAAAVIWKGTLLYVLLALLLNSVANTAVMLTIFLRGQGWAKPNFKVLKPYFSYCLPLVVPQIMAWVITLSDRYFISYFWSTTEVGIYTAAYSLSQLIISVNSVVWFVFHPVMMRLWNNGRYGEVTTYFARGLKLSFLFAIPIAFGLAMLGRPVLTLLSTAEIGQESWRVIPFVSLAHLTYIVYGWGANIFMFQLRTKLSAYAITIAAVVNIVGNFFLIPQYGIMGAAISTVIAYVIMAAISMGIARRSFTFPVNPFFILKSLLAAAVMSTFLWFFNPTEIWEVILGIFAGAAIYFVMLFLTRGFNKEEIEFAKSFIPTKLV